VLIARPPRNGSTSSQSRIRSIRRRAARLAGYLHFDIELIPPGGTIDILARDFVLEPLLEPVP
jgi:hypothetical protein